MTMYVPTVQERRNWGYWDGVHAKAMGRYPQWAKAANYRQAHPFNKPYGEGFWIGWYGETAPEGAIAVSLKWREKMTTVSHSAIVDLACKISGHEAKAQQFRNAAHRLKEGRGASAQEQSDAEIFEKEAAQEDDKICTLCLEMKKLCAGLCAPPSEQFVAMTAGYWAPGQAY